MKKILKKYIALVKEFNKEIVKTWNENDSDAALEYKRNNGIQVVSCGNMQFPLYSLVKMTEYKMQGTTRTEKDYFSTSEFALKKDTIEKYNLTEVDDYLNEKHLWSVYRMMNDFRIPYINVRTVDSCIKHYTDLDKLKKLVEKVNVKQQPLVVEGTDYPYWFNFEGEFIPSNTSNWFKYLQIEYDYIAPSSLVSYTGDDMYDKHLTSQKNYFHGIIKE